MNINKLNKLIIIEGKDVIVFIYRWIKFKKCFCFVYFVKYILVFNLRGIDIISVIISM